MKNRASCFVHRVSRLVLLLAPLAVSPPRPLAAQAPLQDNSFLIEEAYNQEHRVVQHISTAELHHGSALYSFTQEWPVRGQRNQLSYTLAATEDGDVRFGDARLNYRYQAVGGEGKRVWIAPRLSGLVPVGDADKLGGNGGWGLEGVVPVSWEVAKVLTLHGNLGATWRPSGENADGRSAGTMEPYVGGSVIIFITPMLNLMAESIWRDGKAVIADGKAAGSWDQAVTLGARYGINFRSGLQIVPGVAWMPAVGDEPTRSYLYLSFEHPY